MLNEGETSLATKRDILTSGSISNGRRFILRSGRTAFAGVILLSIILLPTLFLAKDKDVTIVVDSKLPDQGSTTVWLGYLLARAKYREDHKVPLPASGEILSSFEEEVYARAYATQIYQEWRAEHKPWHDAYWDILSEIKAKGFLAAYVWTYLHQASWPNGEEPKNLRAFQSWSRSLLQNHKAQTHGALVSARK